MGHVECEVRGRAESGNGSSSPDAATIRWGKFADKKKTSDSSRLSGENASNATIDAFHVPNTFQLLEAMIDFLRKWSDPMASGRSDKTIENQIAAAALQFKFDRLPLYANNSADWLRNRWT